MKRPSTNNIITICIIVLFSGCSKKCKKDPEPQKYILTGRVMETCTNPLKNKNISFLNRGMCGGVASGHHGNKDLGNCLTDDNGYFNFEFELDCGNAIEIGYNGLIFTCSSASGENGNFSKDIGTIYANPKLNFFVKINPHTPKTNLDTLYYYNLSNASSAGTWSKLAGPFTETTLFSCNNYSSFATPNEDYRDINVTFKYTYNPYIVNANITQVVKPFKVCQSSFDSLIVHLP
jgi:hypothetical protein